MVKHREREIEIWPKCLNQNKANTQTAKHKSLLLQDFGFSSKSLYIKNQKTKKGKKKKKITLHWERALFKTKWALSLAKCFLHVATALIARKGFCFYLFYTLWLTDSLSTVLGLLASKPWSSKANCKYPKTKPKSNTKLIESKYSQKFLVYWETKTNQKIKSKPNATQIPK